jgi:hypothetical protein
MKTPSPILALAAALLLPAAAAAQNFSINWYKVSGGGGVSTNGVITVAATIGQPDAGPVLSDGYYSLTGGFWSLIAVQTPGAPVLNIARAGNQAVISWDPGVSGWALQTNVNLATPTWGNYLGAVVNNSITNRPAPMNLFFRLKQ